MSWQNIQSFAMNALLILLSGAVFVFTSDMTPGAELFPRIMAGGLGLFGVIELTLEIIIMRKDKGEQDTSQAIDSSLVKKSIIYMGSFFALIIVFFVSMPFFGFAIMAITFMLISMVLIGGKTALHKWPVALLIPVILIFVFQYGLDVRLPGISIF